MVSPNTQTVPNCSSFFSTALPFMTLLAAQWSWLITTTRKWHMHIQEWQHYELPPIMIMKQLKQLHKILWFTFMPYVGDLILHTTLFSHPNSQQWDLITLHKIIQKGTLTEGNEQGCVNIRQFRIFDQLVKYSIIDFISYSYSSQANNISGTLAACGLGSAHLLWDGITACAQPKPCLMDPS